MSTRRARIAPSFVATPDVAAQSDNRVATLFELRAYAMHPGRRDDLIDMFESDFLDAYESCGARVLATFHDIDVEDRWVWMRAFCDARSRGRALTAFYSSETWRRLRSQANATIQQTRNVLLLRLSSGDARSLSAVPPARRQGGIIVTDVQVVNDGDEDAQASAFEAYARPFLKDFGAAPFATFQTDRSENFYPRQRVRAESVFVWMTRFESEEAYAEFLRTRDASSWWRENVAPRLCGLCAPETMRLRPTSRSRIR